MNQDFCHHRQSETVRHFQRTADGTEAVDGSNSRISHYQTVFVAQIGCTEITFINSALSCCCRSLRSTSSSWARRGAESWYPSRAQTATEGFYILMLDPCATPLARRRRPLPAGVLDLHIHTASYYLRSVFALAVFFGFTVTGNIIITVALALLVVMILGFSNNKPLFNKAVRDTYDTIIRHRFAERCSGTAPPICGSR